jgi:hypothetical protein
MKKNVKNMGFFIFFIAVKKKSALFASKSGEMASSGY